MKHQAHQQNVCYRGCSLYYVLLCRWAPSLWEWRLRPASLRPAPRCSLQMSHCPLMANTGNTFPVGKGLICTVSTFRQERRLRWKKRNKTTKKRNKSQKGKHVKKNKGRKNHAACCTCSLSFSSVSITIEWHLHSHTILQKSSAVWDRGAWVAMK